MSGDLSNHSDNHSVGDMALCTMLAHRTKDPEQIDRIFRKSALMRSSKWDEKHSADGQTYGQITIRKAIEFETQDGEKCEISEDGGSADLPVLDSKALYGFAKRFVELATRNSEADPAAVLITFLVRFAVEVGSNVYMMVGDTRHYARIFAVIVGSSSKSRKGTSARPIDRLFDFSTTRSSPGPLSSGEGIIYAVRDATPGKGGKKGDPGVKDKRLYIIDEELSSALACTKREGNTLSSIIRSAWDKGNLDPLTKTSKITATGAHIGIISHITLYELKLKMRDTEAFNGFANRFLWVHSSRKKKVPLPSPMPADELKVLQRELRSILEKVDPDSPIQLSTAAETLWTQYYDELSKAYPGLVGCVINRAEAQVLRIAMIYCLLDGSSVIEVNHLEAALAVWDYCKKSAIKIFGGRERDPISQKIVKFLKTGPKTKTEIHNKFSNHLNKEVFDIVLNECIESGRIIFDRKKTAGAPKNIYRLNK